MPITLADTMRTLLWHSCSIPSDYAMPGKDIRAYRIELHCQVFIVHAELISTMAPSGDYMIYAVHTEDEEQHKVGDNHDWVKELGNV